MKYDDKYKNLSVLIIIDKNLSDLIYILLFRE